MAAVHGKDAHWTWNSVNLSPYMTEGTLSMEVENAETTTMGDSYVERLSGIKDWSVDVSGVWSGTAAEVDATLGGAIGTSAAGLFKGNSAAVGANNPSYSGNAILTSYEISADIGDAVAWSATFEGNGTLTRTAA